MISGSTISSSVMTAGGGAVTIGADGIALTAGTGVVNAITWSNGALVRGFSGSGEHLLFQAPNSIWSELGNGCLLIQDTAAFGPASGNSNSHIDLGRSDGPWQNIYADNLILTTAGDLSATISDFESRIAALEALHE